MKGFSLLECMVYCAISSYMMALVAPCAFRIIDQCKQRAQQLAQSVQQQACNDVFIRLLETAPACCDDWQSHARNNPIWFDVHHNHYKELLIKDKNLCLRYGTYNKTKQKWSKYKTIKIMADVTELKTECLMENNYVTAIAYSLVQTDTTQSGLAALHNRVMLCS